MGTWRVFAISANIPYTSPMSPPIQENENRLLEEKLNRMEVRMHDEACGVQGQLSVVAHQNSTLMHKV